MKTKLKKEFLDNLKQIYSKEDINILEEGFNSIKRKTSFRVNVIKSSNEEIEGYMKSKKIAFTKLDFLDNAYYLNDLTEKDLWETSIFKEGKIYLQSISSQIPVSLLEIKENQKILDIAASPGGKTTQAATMLKNTGEIIALDNNQIRIDKLNFTINRQGAKNIKVIKLDARKLIETNKEYIGYFDKIIADLPCSAEARFNLNKEKTYAYWTPNLLKKNYRLQKEILKSIIPLLKVNGELVYSTCTISAEENEDIVHMIISNFKELILEEIKIDFEYARPGITNYKNKVFKKEMQKTLRILPSILSEGFFVAKFKKVV